MDVESRDSFDRSIHIHSFDNPHQAGAREAEVDGIDAVLNIAGIIISLKGQVSDT